MRRYGVPPANAVDIGYIPDFFVRYFAKVYYKETGVILFGRKAPINHYVFTIENGVEEESVKILEELDLGKRLYVLMLYSGEKSKLKVLNRKLFKKKANTVKKKQKKQLK